LVERGAILVELGAFLVECGAFLVERGDNFYVTAIFLLRALLF